MSFQSFEGLFIAVRRALRWFSSSEDSAACPNFKEAQSAHPNCGIDGCSCRSPPDCQIPGGIPVENPQVPSETPHIKDVKLSIQSVGYCPGLATVEDWQHIELQLGVQSISRALDALVQRGHAKMAV